MPVCCLWLLLPCTGRVGQLGQTSVKSNIYYLALCRSLLPPGLCYLPGLSSSSPGHSPRAFPVSSVGKVSACNVGDPHSIPGSGKSNGEDTGYPLQYSWASLVAQLVKNLPTIQETRVRSLGWEEPLEKGKATHSSILAWRIPWTV